MRRFQDILVVVASGTDAVPVIERGAALARNSRGRVSTMDIETPMDATESDRRSMRRSAAALALATEHDRRAARRTGGVYRSRPAGASGLSARIPCGSPHRRIAGEVARNRHDLVMIAAGRRGDPPEEALTRMAARLIRECPCPVWVIRTTRVGQRRCVLAAVDPDPTDSGRDALNEEVMELAVSLARMEERDLRVVNAWTPYGASLLTGPLAGMTGEQVKHYVEQTRDSQSRQLFDLLRRHPLAGVSHRVHLVCGTARWVIPAMAAATGAESIVVGAACRGGAARWILGNTSDVVLRSAECSVLATRAPGAAAR